MSRPYGYAGRPTGSPATRLSSKGRALVEGSILLAVIAVCWTATLLLPHYAHTLPGVDPQTPVEVTR